MATYNKEVGSARTTCYVAFPSQKEVQDVGLTLKDYLPPEQEKTATKGPMHEDNSFGISLVSEGDERTQEGEKTTPQTNSGCIESVDDLAAKLRALQG